MLFPEVVQPGLRDRQVLTQDMQVVERHLLLGLEVRQTALSNFGDRAKPGLEVQISQALVECRELGLQFIVSRFLGSADLFDDLLFC